MSYALVKIDTGEIIQSYQGDVAPNVVVWPNGDASSCPIVGDERGGARFVSVIYGPDSPGEFYQLSDVKPQLNGPVLSFVRIWAPIDLATAQAIVASRVDALAEAARARYMTPGSGQALTYWQKLAEAKALAGDASPTAANYPLLSASINGTATPAALATAAQAVGQAANQWTTANARIEKLRLQLKAQVMAAATVDATAGVVVGLSFP